MAKRFTDTEKWADSWFRNLKPDFQRFWFYLLDKCDSAGVWKVDFEMAEFCLKQKYDQKKVETALLDRIRVFDNGARWFVPKFITYQYGCLNENCKPHQSVLRLLNFYKIEGYLKGIHTLKDKNKIKIKNKTRQDEPKFCHDCSKYFPNDLAFEKHLTGCNGRK